MKDPSLNLLTQPASQIDLFYYYGSRGLAIALWAVALWKLWEAREATRHYPSKPKALNVRSGRVPAKAPLSFAPLIRWIYQQQGLDLTLLQGSFSSNQIAITFKTNQLKSLLPLWENLKTKPFDLSIQFQDPDYLFTIEGNADDPTLST